MKKISKISNIIALIFTLIGVFLWVDIGYSLRIPHGCTSKTTIDRLTKIRIEALVRKVEKVKQREIELEINGQKKNFFVMEWEKASQWIYKNYPGLVEFERNMLLYTDAADDTLFDNSESLAEEFEIYKAPVMIKLRRAGVEVILRLWRYTAELLKESFLKLGLTEEITLVDIGPGANPGSCLLSDNIIAINKEEHPFTMKRFIDFYSEMFGPDLYQEIFGITKEDIDNTNPDRKLHYKMRNVDNPDNITEAIEEVYRTKEAIRSNPKVWLLSNIYIAVGRSPKEAFWNLWIDKMYNLIGEKDLIIISGYNSDKLTKLFLESDHYEDVAKYLPGAVRNIFKQPITATFWSRIHTDSQYIQPLFSIRILRKKKQSDNTSKATISKRVIRVNI